MGLIVILFSVMFSKEKLLYRCVFLFPSAFGSQVMYMFTKNVLSYIYITALPHPTWNKQWPLYMFLDLLFENEVLGYNGSFSKT